MQIVRTLFVAGYLGLAASVVGAQGMPIPPPPRGDFLGSASSFERRSELGGMTTTGRATVNAAPDRMRIEVYNFQPFAPPGQPQLATVRPDEAVTDALDAMHKAGIVNARAVRPLFPSGNNNAAPAIVASIEKPTRERVEALVALVIGGLPRNIASILGNVQVQSGLEIDDCSTAETRAMTAALADARARAEAIAKATHLHLGRTIAIDARPTYPVNGCATKPDVARPQGIGFNGGFPSSYGPLVVAVSATVTVTYEIVR